MGYNEIDLTHQNVEEFFATVSHELKTPLQEIALYAKVIEEDSGGLMLPQSREDLRSIQEVCKTAMDMIQLFIKYSKIHNSVLNWEVVSMRDLITECFAAMTRPLTDRTFSLTVEELPNVIGDQFLLRQMVTNILSNSIKFTVNRAVAELRVSAVQDGGVTSFAFEDNGIGLNIKYAAKIFDLFERVHSEDGIEGSGIGLALVKSIVERFNGDVEVFSEENKGCTITVKLPDAMVISPRRTRQIREDRKRKITIGIILASYGEYAGIAPCRKHAYELAAEEINAAGGIGGKKVVLKFRDFGSDVTRVSRIAWELAAVEQVDVLMGGQLSSAREHIREVADKMGIPYFFNALYEGGLADHYTFCVSATPEQNVYPMLNHLFSVYGAKCYIIAADYNYGVLTAEFTKDFIEKVGGVVAGVEFFSVQKTSFDTTISNIKRVQPDILLSFCVSNNQNNFYEQWYKDGIPGLPVVSTIGIGLSYLHRRSPPPTMSNTYFMSSFIEELDIPAAQAFTKKLKSRYDMPYIEFDAETAYTAVYLYKNAVEKAGSSDTEKVIQALESGEVSFDGPGGRVTMRGEDHHTRRDEILFRVNEEHHIEKVQSYPALQSSFVEKAILQEMGCPGGLKALGKNAPNVQYNMMFHRIV